MFLVSNFAFPLEFEKIYVNGDPEKVSRCRLCVFQLIHIPAHIKWNGSVRAGSQATVERAIGEMGHKIRSRKAPFANLANLILERELVKLLRLYHPQLDSHKQTLTVAGITPFTMVKVKKRERQPDNPTALHISAICASLNIPSDLTIPLSRWAKLHLPNGRRLSSLCLANQPARVSYHFQAQGSPSHPIFGRAIGFFQVDGKPLLVLFNCLVNIRQNLNRWAGTWSKDISVLPATDVIDLVGVFNWKDQRVHILQKHAGLEMLGQWERRNEEDEGEGADEDETEGTEG